MQPGHPPSAWAAEAQPPSPPAGSALHRASAGATAATATLLLLVLAGGSLAPLLGPPAGASVERRMAQLCVDPNVAGSAELQLLPGIGPTLAQNIIDYRAGCDESPAFRRPEDLDAVPRIGPRTVERLRPFLRFAAAPNARQSAAPPER